MTKKKVTKTQFRRPFYPHFALSARMTLRDLAECATQDLNKIHPLYSNLPLANDLERLFIEVEKRAIRQFLHGIKSSVEHISRECEAVDLGVPFKRTTKKPK